MLIKSLVEATKSVISGRPREAAVYPLEIEQQIGERHSRAPVDRHLEILFKDMRVGHENFAELYSRCLQQTGTAVTPFNVFQRFQTRFELVQYFLATAAVPGARAECGVYRGATALLLCHAQRSCDPQYDGRDFHLIDSYAGTSASTSQDFIPVRNDGGTARMQAFFPAGKTDTSPELVRGFFTEFPHAQVRPGWIPQVFATLPERDWAFIHLDLTLFEPTLSALEYFYPRLNKGGVIVCDGSIFCPGADKALEQFCAAQRIAYVVLGHRSSVIIK